MLPPPELINDKDVVALTERNFTNFIENNQRVQVIFHSSAWKVTGASLVAKVDCETLAEMYKIREPVKAVELVCEETGDDVANCTS
ncbi:hypothetical protein WN944_018482 [Citrus x changshan-huyou]|uniref:Uncharacterized protein n=1 Tax=Citrus x changshan-huyou TaxID=2935761 RepID=A0AAP0LWF3_9ROSI